MEILKSLKIAVFSGGNSRERDISLSTGKGVHEALLSKGLNAVFVDLTEEDEDQVRGKIYENKIDVVFIAMHGRFGEDGTLQGILEAIGVPFTGSGPVSSLNAFDKLRTKLILEKQDILQSDFFCLKKGEYKQDLLKELEWKKFVVKPACQGSSIGVHVCDDHSLYKKAVDEVLSIDKVALVEEFIEGKEITVGIVNETALPVVGIVPRGGTYFDFNCKYTKGATSYEVPASISDEVSLTAREKALIVHRALGLRHFSRVDMILSEDQRVYILEANSIPGLTPTSLLPKAAHLKGVDYATLCTLMVKMAMETQYEKEAV